MAFTKVRGRGVTTTDNYTVGVITATKFVGPITGGGGGINVGVLTATELDLNGNGNISGNLVVDGNLTANGDFTTLNTTLREVELLKVNADSSTTAGIITQTGAGDILNLFDGSTEVFTVLDTGEVGIGTDNPGTPLHVYHATTNEAARFESGDATCYITFGDSASNASGTNRPLLGAKTNDLFLQTGGTERLRINSSGRVGIGTTTLAASSRLTLLEETGNAQTLEIKATTATSTGSQPGIKLTANNGDNIGGIFGDVNSDQLRIQTGGTDRIIVNNIGITSIQGQDDQDNFIVDVNNTEFAVHTDASDGEVSLRAQDGTANNYSKYMTFFTQKSGEAATERVRITTDGKFGVNSTAPSASLEVRTLVGLGTASGDEIDIAEFRSITTNDTKLIIQNVRIGDGTTWTTAATRIQRRVDSTDMGYIDFGTGAGTGGKDIAFGNAGSEKVRILHDGKVGIGLTNPSVLLEVKSSGNTVGILTSTTNGANLDIYDDDTQLRIRSVSGKAHFYADVNNDVDESSFRFFVDGTVSSKEKLNIVGAGITVFGEIATEQDYPDYRPSLDLNFAAVKKLDSRIVYYRGGNASYTDEFGIVRVVGSNTPRFDHDPVTKECKGLLVEEARTNYCKNSSDLSQKWASATGGYGIDNAITNPDGTVGAQYHKGAEWYHTMDVSGASTNVITVSAWVKERSGQSGNLTFQVFQQVSGGVVDMGAFNFDPATATLGTADANFSDGIVTEYPNGWYRISVKATTDSGNFSSSTRLDQQGLEHYVWGIQVEAGSYATSYIPTYGFTSTRSADSLTIKGKEFSDLYNQKEGTLMVNGYVPPTTLISSPATKNSVSLRGSSQTLHSIRYVSHASDATQRYVDSFQLLANGTNVVDHGGSNTNAIEDRYYKHITTFKKDDYAYAFNGGYQVWTDTSGDLPEMDRLIIGEAPTQFFIKRVVYYPKRLPNSQLTTLVS